MKAIKPAAKSAEPQIASAVLVNHAHVAVRKAIGRRIVGPLTSGFAEHPVPGAEPETVLTILIEKLWNSFDRPVVR